MKLKFAALLMVCMCMLLAGCGGGGSSSGSKQPTASQQSKAEKEKKEPQRLVTPKEFVERYNAALDYMGKEMKKDYKKYKITKTKKTDDTQGTFENKGDIGMGYTSVSGKDAHMTSVMVAITPGDPPPPSYVIANAVFMGAINPDILGSMSTKNATTVLEPLTSQNQASNYVIDNGVVIGYMANNTGFAFTVMLEEKFKEAQQK